MTKRHCVVIMPFGTVPDNQGRIVNFDALFQNAIEPALASFKLKPLRMDQKEISETTIPKTIYEQLILCDYVIVDLTTANANIFYLLGLRQGIRAAKLISTYASGSRLKVDDSFVTSVSYQVEPDGKPSNVLQIKLQLENRLQAPSDDKINRFLFQILEEFPGIQRLKTDVFRDWVHYCESTKNRLTEARKQGLQAVVDVEQELVQQAPIHNIETSIVIDLFLSYRAVQGWQQMIDLILQMSEPLKTSVMVQEQYAFALNRIGCSHDAEQILIAIINEHGDSSETYSLLGRVYKDQWENAVKAGNPKLAAELLTKAINAYLKGFETDWRDAFPGINTVTLMELAEPPDKRRINLQPVVTYAVQRRIASAQPDYWDFATLIELGVLAKNPIEAEAALSTAVTYIREPWEPESTARNLQLIVNARKKRGETNEWVEAVIAKLKTKSKEL